MQAAAYYPEKTVVETPRQNDKRFLPFSLQGALPAGHTLVLNTRLGTLSYLYFSDEGPRLKLQQQFSGNELNMLIHLLDSYPHYCPYEVLYASFYNGDLTDLIIARSRRHLQKALETGTWARETRQVRRAISRIRLKLQVFGFNISSILETGYILRIPSVPDR